MASVLVLGGYGLIGSACMKALGRSGCKVTGLGRSRAAADRIDASWIIRDIARTDTQEWRKLLDGFDVVVNASGALQDGPLDDLEAIHHRAITRIVAALEGTDTKLVQISAAGVAADATTAFRRTKARGDAVIRASGIHWVILRPTMVIGPDAYGGSALLRAAAAIPLFAPQVLPDALVQTVHIDDLAQAVVQAATGAIAQGTEADVTEPDARSLPRMIATMRLWLGFAEARTPLPAPHFVLSLLAACADVAGRLGWRSPLRSTAVDMLRHGVVGNPTAWLDAGGRPCRSLQETLADIPATMQERCFARMYLVLPLVIVLLSVFWLASGMIGLLQYDAAREVLTARGHGATFATIAVGGGALADIALGLAILWRPWARRACLGMIAVSLAYMIGGTLLTPDLWADPMGPFTKILPGIGLALVTFGLIEER